MIVLSSALLLITNLYNIRKLLQDTAGALSFVFLVLFGRPKIKNIKFKSAGDH